MAVAAASAATAALVAESHASALIALCRRRQRARLGAWLGWAGAIAAAVVFVTFSRASSGAGDLASRLLGDALRWVCVLGVTPLALSLAADPVAQDRRDGIELMVAVRGRGPAALELARVVAAIQETSLRVAAAGLLVCVASGWALSWQLVLVSVAGTVVIALLSGVTLGGLAVVCGQLGAERGRALLAAVVLVPWLLSDFWTMPGLSIPGLLDAAIDGLVRLLDRLGGYR